MSREPLDKSYSPEAVEKRWYAFWEAEKLFAADETTTRTPYSIVIPPPNVTGVLHMGHALNNTMQDIMCRYRRLKGDSVLWMPGTDHAGIATQNVVEKKLAAEGTDRHAAGKREVHRVGVGMAQSSTAAPSSTSSSGWAPPATGIGNASPWTKGSRKRCGKYSSSFMTRD